MRASCADETHRRGGRPRLDPALERKGFTHGWLVAVDAQTSKIVSLACMKRPENNAMVLEMMEKLVEKFPKLKTLIYDRACALVKQAKSRKTLARVRHYAVDKFHAYRHSKKCVASPLVHKSLARAISGINTSAAEQTFAWLKRYASSLNNMTPEAHEFFLLAFCRMHNECLGTKWAPSVLRSRKRAHKSRKYGC